MPLPPRIVAELFHADWYELVIGRYLLASTFALPVFSRCGDTLGTAGSPPPATRDLPPP